MSPVVPVILCGGSGTRLWPMSRVNYPKQLLALAGHNTLLQDTLVRARAVAGTEAPVLICNIEHRFLVRTQCDEVGIQTAVTWLEPVGRNTAPAIALAALDLAEIDPDTVMLVLPADHVVEDLDSFVASTNTAVLGARAGNLVTFGIEPTSPESGYGYILQDEEIRGLPGIFKVKQFVEKPNETAAKKYIEEGGYVWNSGMFVFTARSYLDELKAHRPDILAAAQKAWRERKPDLSFTKPGESFADCPTESIDYAVMQATTRAAVVPASFGWNDVGSWSSLWNIAPKDEQGNAAYGQTCLLNTSNSYVRAESRMVSVIGMTDVVVVETADAVLVMNKDNAQEIKQVIAQMEVSERTEHLNHLRVHRPWGWYEGIDEGERFKVKRIMVQPGEKLSLQKHHHRAEHWIVVQGTAKVTLENHEVLLTENQSTYIPLGQIHRLENPGKIPLHLIEVQSGTYLGEDDIVRIEDIYSRNCV